VHVHLIHNPAAGDRATTAERLRALIVGLGHDVTYQSTAQPGWRAAVRPPADLYAVAGGDGLFADLLATAEEEEAKARVRGGVDDGRRLLRSLLAADPPAERWSVWLDGVDLSGDYLAVEVLNVGEIGPRVPIAPSADPGDGLLDVVLLDPAQGRALHDDLERAASACRATTAEGLAAGLAATCRQGRTLRMRPPPTCALHLDDRGRVPDRAGAAVTELEVSVDGTGVQVLAP